MHPTSTVSVRCIAVSYTHLDVYKSQGSALTPNFWRAPTDNDFGAGLQRKYAAWKNPELKLTSLKHAIENDQAGLSSDSAVTDKHRSSRISPHWF